MVDGAELFSDKAKAVKVRHEDGRIDYIVYASNGKVTYRVDDTFNFKGFIGVYTMKDGKPILAYMNDSEFIGEFEGVPAITGKINNFTKQLSAENSITVTAQQVVDPEMLAGKFIYINNDGNENAVYEIKSARAGDNNTLILELGNNTLIRSYKNNSDLSDGYIYNIAENQNYRIPLGYSFDSSPVFDEIGERNVDVLSELRIQINAISPVDKELLYSAATLPRGARFDPETKTLIWRPEVNQVGKNHVAIEASDGDSSAILHFYINVLPSTVSSKNTPAGESNGQSGIDNPHPDAGTDYAASVKRGEVRRLRRFQLGIDAINDLTGRGL